MGIFEKQQRKLKRSAKLVKILSKYGFQDVLIRLNITQEPLRDGTIAGGNLTEYERIRMALEELGPTFVKLGQTFSDREDLLPLPLIEQLRLLQDKVVTLPLDVPGLIEANLGTEARNQFKEIQVTPLAAASIAQVYRATLQDDTEVIIKVKRPGIDGIIADDILILKDIVALIDTYSDVVEQVNMKQAILAFEKSLKEELSLNNERANIKQFATNFAEHPATYVPKVFDDLSSDAILTMEFIEGTKITDIASLQQQNISPVQLADAGYELFVTQILDYGFFHADPHAGNILVNPQGQIIFIDFGAVGKIPPMERNLFENLILAFMAKKSNKIVRLLKKMAIYYKIPDERHFEMDVQSILEYVHNASLKDINVAYIMDQMKDVLKTNRLVMPEYFYLLFKGISLMDGVGRQLNPNLDVVNSLKPYTKKILKRKLAPERLAQQATERITDLVDQFEEMPKELRSLLSKLDENQFTVRTEIQNISRVEQLLKSGVTNIILAIVLAANMILCGSILTVGNPVLLTLNALFSLLLVIILLVRLLRR